MEAGDIQAMEATDFHSRAGECSTEDFKSVKDELESTERSMEEMAPEEEAEQAEEVEESASTLEASNERQQQLLREFDAVHDEAQQLRIMNLLLQCRVRRFMQQRLKVKKALSSAFFTAAHASASVGGTTVTSERLEEELQQAGEVRRQLQAEARRGAEEDALRQRLETARQQVAERAAQLQQLQGKLLSRMRAPPARRQEAERLLKRVWPQLQRLHKERLLHSRATHKLEIAKRQASELEEAALGPQLSVTEYEELVADAARLAQREEVRAEQLAAVRSVAEQSLQQAAHLREALRGARREVLLAQRRDETASAQLHAARQQVGKMHKKRNELFKEKNKLEREMELLAYPELLRDHEEVRQRLRATQAELEKLRATYLAQEQRIAAARRLVLHSERALHCPPPPQPTSQQYRLPAKRAC